MTPTYNTWRDRAENIGVQCTICNRTIWTGFEPTLDPTTGQDCANCVLIKLQGVLATVNGNKEVAEDNPTRYPFTQPDQTDENGRDVIDG